LNVRDVIVVGGGPAGAASAIFLRQRGHDVLLLDEARFPRDKICGEGISPEAWRLLGEIGASATVRALRPRALLGMTLQAPDGTAFTGCYGGGRAGLAVRRSAFDDALLEVARSAGVEVREGARVSGAIQDEATVTGVYVGDPEGRTVERARVVIVADGRRSHLARQLGGLRENGRLRKFAVRAHVFGLQGLSAHGEMHVGGGGYCGIAPLSETEANVAFVLDQAALSIAGGDLETFFHETLARWPQVKERMSGASLQGSPRAVGPLALVARRVSVPGALLVGDAAGFYDPFTGEGVTLALRSAELAAGVVDLGLRRGGLGDLREYDRLRSEATAAKFRLNRLIQTVVGWPALANEMAHRLRRRPRLADRLVGIAGDFVPARSAFDPRFLLDLLTA
jgi:geranylgeranyl reductase family protein